MMVCIGHSFRSGSFSLPQTLGPAGVIVHRLFTAGMTQGVFTARLGHRRSPIHPDHLHLTDQPVRRTVERRDSILRAELLAIAGSGHTGSHPFGRTVPL